jgi:hypothetical protein
MHFVRWWLVLFAPLCLLACSRSTTALPSVEGKVVLREQPVEGVIITFHRKGADPIQEVRPVGRTKEDGTFTLTTGTQDGAAAGEYIVTFIWPKEVKAEKGFSTAAPQSRDEFFGAYAEASKSPFQVEIRPGANKLAPFLLK